MPNMPATPRIWTRFAPVTARERKIRSGMSGRRAVACLTRNAPSRASEQAPSMRVLAASQPCWAAGSTIVNTPSIIAPVISSAPGTSAPAPQAGAAVALDHPPGDDRRGRADRQVDEEDPVPAEDLGEDAARQQADRRARGRD